MVAERISLGLIFTYSKNWIGGSYYILNLIHALNSLADQDKPEITIFCKTDVEFKKVTDTGYPFLKKYILEDNSKTINNINKVTRFVLGKNILGKRIDPSHANIIFPANRTAIFENIPQKLFWIPDFQEKHYPHFFSQNALRIKEAKRKKLAYSKENLVLSSLTAKSDLDKFYPNNTVSVQTLPFAVTHPAYSHLDHNMLLDKFNLPKRYFFSPNQFYKHKNHIAIFEAVRELSKDIPDLVIAFSGKEEDSRDPDHMPSLRKFIKTNGLEKHVRLLGFIDRAEQLKLMEQAVGIIQPSLFEGWSTVIEDAKAMDQIIIASNIDIHKEQLRDQADFFDPHRPEQLSAILKEHWKTDNTKPRFNYEERIKDFGKNFLTIIQNLNK